MFSQAPAKKKAPAKKAKEEESDEEPEAVSSEEEEVISFISIDFAPRGHALTDFEHSSLTETQKEEEGCAQEEGDEGQERRKRRGVDNLPDPTKVSDQSLAVSLSLGILLSTPPPLLFLFSSRTQSVALLWK